MIKRYLKEKIAEIWSDAWKVAGWDNTELAVIDAKTRVGRKRITVS